MKRTASGDADPFDQQEPPEGARVIPLLVQHAAGGAAGGTGLHGSATPAAVRGPRAGETSIPASE